MKPSNNTWTQSETDGVIDSHVSHQAHEGKIYHSRGHNKDNKAKILERNARIRREKPLTSKVMRENKLIMSIPQGDYQSLLALYPELNSDVMADKAKAYQAIASAHPEYIQHQKR